jgi:hypothetical protein
MSILSGWFGEKRTTFSMWLSLDKKTYRRFHDVIIPSKNGTTQIDHILVSSYGVFIVETKNLTGWIFGSKDQPKWTQSLYGKNYSFQNPIRQTFRQKKILAGYFALDESVINTVVYFVGDCKFKTQLPANVIKSGLGGYIKQFHSRLFEAEEVERIVREIVQHVSKSTLTTKDHVQSLRERHNSTTVCPKCGSNLAERPAKKGPTTGSKFLGCENYPRCRYAKNS